MALYSYGPMYSFGVEPDAAAAVSAAAADAVTAVLEEYVADNVRALAHRLEAGGQREARLFFLRPFGERRRGWDEIVQGGGRPVVG